MAVQQASAGIIPSVADFVGKAFVPQYYLIQHQSPEHVHRFYQDISKLGRPEANGIMGITTTMKAINEKILSLDYGDFRVEIVTVDAQDSYNDGVLVLVTGYLTGKDNMRRKFTQTFFLAPQDKGYFVLNDIFRYVDEAQLSDVDPDSSNDVEAPLVVGQDTAHDQENDINERIPEPLEEAGQEDVYNPSENGDVSVEEENPVPEVVDEINVDSDAAAESCANYDTPKKSYASMVMVKKVHHVQLPASKPASLKVSPVAQDQQITASLPPTRTVESQLSSSIVTESGSGQESESDGHSIYLKGLPMNVTYPQIETEFNKFGRIKSGGIQIRSQRGFYFGFVEYEERSAAVSAIEASPITIGGRQVVVEPKKSTARVNTREGFPSGRLGGFRSDGPRGRGTYGGNRGYGRGEMNNRPDFRYRNSSRGGYTYRGDGGHQRAENPHRSFNGRDTTKGLSPRVPATA